MGTYDDGEHSPLAPPSCYTCFSVYLDFILTATSNERKMEEVGSVYHLTLPDLATPFYEASYILLALCQNTHVILNVIFH